jgi:hypothetical protein
MVVALLWCAAVAALGVASVCSWGPSWSILAVQAHPGRDEWRFGRAGVERIQPAEAVARLEALDPSTDAALGELARIIAAGMTNGFPAPDEVDPAYAPSPIEHLPLWIEFTRARREPAARDRALELSHLERERWRNGLRLGLGYCSQASLVAADFLREHGVDAHAYGLGGHVVTRAFTDRGERIVDADYGVVLPFGLERAAADPATVRSLYLAVGYHPDQVEMVVAMYGPDGNERYLGRTVETEGRALRRAWSRAAWRLAAVSAAAAALATIWLVRRRSFSAAAEAATPRTHAS